MDLSFGNLFAMIMLSVIGFSFIRYGRKAGEIKFVISGVALLCASYFVKGLWPTVITAIILIGAPFLI